MISQRPPGSEARAGRFPGPSLIPALHAIQREHGWLPREELVRLSRDWRRPLYEIEGLISFYPHFRTAPPPERTEVACCHDLSCWLHGSEERLAELRADPSIELREVSCIGRCDRAPAVSTESELRRGEVQRPNDPYDTGARDYRLLRADGAHRDQHALEHEVRLLGKDLTVLERARLGLVGVADHVLRLARLAAHHVPLAARREAGAAHPLQA